VPFKARRALKTISFSRKESHSLEARHWLRGIFEGLASKEIAEGLNLSGKVRQRSPATAL
jgi:hypothetical protein